MARKNLEKPENPIGPDGGTDSQAEASGRPTPEKIARVKRKYRKRKKPATSEYDDFREAPPRPAPPFDPIFADCGLMVGFAFLRMKFGEKWIPTEEESEAIRRSLHRVLEKRMPEWMMDLQPELALLGSVGAFIGSRLLSGIGDQVPEGGRDGNDVPADPGPAWDREKSISAPSDLGN